MAKTKAKSASKKKVAKSKARASAKKKVARRATGAGKKTTAKKSAGSAPRKKQTAPGAKKKTSTRDKKRPAAKAAAASPSKSKAPSKPKAMSRTAPKAKAKTVRKAKVKAKVDAKASVNGDNHRPRARKRKPSSRLKPEDLAVFREQLLDKRAELAGDVTNLRREAMRRDNQNNDHHLSNMPTHMADLGSDNWEQEFTLGLLDKDMALLKEIDDALGRINDGTYGLCLATDKAIGKARLRAKPWAKYCIEYAEKLEKGLVR